MKALVEGHASDDTPAHGRGEAQRSRGVPCRAAPRFRREQRRGGGVARIPWDHAPPEERHPAQA